MTKAEELLLIEALDLARRITLIAEECALGLTRPEVAAVRIQNIAALTVLELQKPSRSVIDSDHDSHDCVKEAREGR